ncbi:unnamed protein product [Vitrella brassicaformis CCMP3155]|uniref:TLDc domain-containing protein n=2 Tax=Vitrella brassicaformis TaxID=1169539 RepID=A0A0G4G1A9_VITBC|nr:unnamed protein product [Vitrella brassicaformis CCMP3155]|eukprot:CEM21854.1 unnamed protein product [Vitrella brassicaformis CCMP3155]
MGALQRLSELSTFDVTNLWPYLLVTRSLVELNAVFPMAPSQLAWLLHWIETGEPGSPGPLAYLRVIISIKLCGIASTDLRDGLQDLQKCLVDRGCSKSLDYLCFIVDRSDCHSLILNDYATFKALATFIDATCSPSGDVVFSLGFPTDDVGDIPLAHLLAYTRFGKVPSCGLPILNTLLTHHNLCMKPEEDWPEPPYDCPSIESYTQPAPPSAFHYVWTVTEDHVARPQNGPIDLSLMEELTLGGCGNGHADCIFCIECAEGFSPPADAIPPEPPELRALSPSGLEGVKALIVKHRMGLGVAKMVLTKGAHLESLVLMDMGAMDVLALLEGISSVQMPQRLKLDSLRAQDGEIQQQVAQLDSAYALIVNKKLQGVKELMAKGEVAIRLVARLKRHMPSLDMLTVCGSETEMRQALMAGDRGAINRLSLGFMSLTRNPARLIHEFIKAEDEREGITLGDWKDQLPSIKSILMHLDVPSAHIVDPGAFILGSIWSLLEIESITELIVVLPQHSHLDALKLAVERRFGPDQILDQMGGMVRAMTNRKYLVLTSNDIQAMRKAAFACSHSTACPSAQLHGYLPSLAALATEASTDILACDFAGRISAATPMTVIDPPYAPRCLKAPLLAAMERHGLAMEPMMRLHGDGPGIPSPSVIASAAQLMAVLRKTGKDITGIQPLYKATVHGFAYTDMLCRVGHATPLLFLVRANGDTHGFFIDTSLRPPPQIRTALGVIFMASGSSQPAFASSLMSTRVIAEAAAPNDRAVGPQLVVGRQGADWLCLWELAVGGLIGASCLARVGWAAWEGRVETMLADEVEVMQLQGA